MTSGMQALTFDLRRASHSIGSNVRDAAAYLLWSLSRACPPSTLAPFAEQMATRLICVAVYDREVGVRRAASAAFQEGVGRLVSSYIGTALSDDLSSTHAGIVPRRHRRLRQNGFLLGQRPSNGIHNGSPSCGYVCTD